MEVLSQGRGGKDRSCKRRNWKQDVFWFCLKSQDKKGSGG
jgi:hypothetical protein